MKTAMTKEGARNWIRVFSDIPDDLREPCCHGHKACSNTKGGVCFDDAIHAGVIDVDASEATA